MLVFLLAAAAEGHNEELYNNPSFNFSIDFAEEPQNIYRCMLSTDKDIMT